MAMKNFLDKLQEAWQSQCHKPLDVNPDQLLKTARLEQRTNYWVDILVILVFSCFGAFMVWSAFRKDIHEDWPYLISAASGAWVVGYVLFDRWRRRRDAAHYDNSVLAHVEQAIKELEHQKWLSRNTLWWYILPIALGCMIPPVFFFAMEYGERPLLDSLMPLLVTEGTFAAVFYFVHWVMKNGRHKGLERQRQELQALGALRESLLNAEE
jgi:cytochrome bd-type quinol oxidase subunit 2